MARSRSITDATIAAQAGTAKSLSNPQRCLSEAKARPTAVAGSRILVSAVFSATIARLLGQRRSLEHDLGLRGTAASHSAIAVNTTMKAASLVAASLMGMVDSS